LFWISAGYEEAIYHYEEDRNITSEQFDIWAEHHYEIWPEGIVFAYIDEEGDTSYCGKELLDKFADK